MAGWRGKDGRVEDRARNLWNGTEKKGTEKTEEKGRGGMSRTVWRWTFPVVKLPAVSHARDAR